jgi:hypothetical protein
MSAASILNLAACVWVSPIQIKAGTAARSQDLAWAGLLLNIAGTAARSQDLAMG